ncbi:hypothetical protein B0H19DRAFT_1273413 [Mycena capillaripes]|nr:hypothetical protein B0H19DRAFT_1273413 [Mycena capillaripes]
MSFPSTPVHPPSVQSCQRPSLQLSGFSTMFQQWDLASEESPTSRRGSLQFDLDYSSSSQTPLSNPDFDTQLVAPHTRQRTTQACDKCRDRKTKARSLASVHPKSVSYRSLQCSGDHPVCKRCTARGLICHYSGRERPRGPAKARLRNVMSSSSLDTRFAGDSGGDATIIKQEAPAQSVMYSLEYGPQPQPRYQQLAFPTRREFQYSQPRSQAGSPARDPAQLSAMPQFTHRRVQSHSALGTAEAYRHHTNPTLSRLGPSSLLEFDTRMSNGGLYSYQDDGSSGFVPILFLLDLTFTDIGATSSEATSATGSVFSADNFSRSSGSSESMFHKPIPRCASELDLRAMYQLPQYGHQRFSNSESDTGGVGYEAAARFGYHSPAAFHSPAGSISSVNEISSPGLGPPDIPVPLINEKFGNPWADNQPVTVREVELVYPSPITPISIGNEAIDIMERRGF